MRTNQILNSISTQQFDSLLLELKNKQNINSQSMLMAFL